MGVFQASMRSKLTRRASGDRSDTGLPEIPIPFNFTNPFRGDKSVIAFCSRPSQSTLVKLREGGYVGYPVSSQLDIIQTDQSCQRG